MSTIHANALFVESTLTLSASIGYTQFNQPSDQTLIISDYVSDLLTNSKRHNRPTYNFDVKQQLNINSNVINKVMLGPAFYFQQARNTGEVWELFSPEFYNYQYDLKSNNIDFLIESDLYFKPVFSKVNPFVTAGIGFGVADFSYNDYALPGIPLDSERHWSATQTKALYELGAGFSVPVNAQINISLRYAFIYMGKVNASVSQYQPISMNLNNQNVLLGVHYSL